jgi:hypothetical protein
MRNVPKKAIVIKNTQTTKSDAVLNEKNSTKSHLLKSTSLIVLSFAGLAFTSGRALSEEARSTESFIDSLGVAVHLSYTDTSYGQYSTIIKPRLKELGIRHIRDGVTLKDSITQDKFNDLAKIGIKSTLVMDPRDLSEASEAVSIAKSVANSVEAIEGPNELDMYPNVTYKGNAFPQGVRQFQEELYQAIKADSKTAHLPVIGPSITQWDKNDIAKLGGLRCDKNNLHLYFSPWIPEQYPIDEYFIPAVKPICGSNKPSIATEMGYHNDFRSNTAGVPESISAKYLPRFLLKNFNRGIERSYLYQLIDEKQTPEFGLLRSDGTPKPAFTTLKNLISIVNSSTTGTLTTKKSLHKKRTLHNNEYVRSNRKQRGPQRNLTFIRKLTSQNSLGFQLMGNMSSIEHTLLQEAPNVYYLILWQAVESYSVSSRRVISVPNKSVKILLDAPARQAVFFNPLKSAKPISSVSQSKELNVSVPDHPLIVKLILY